MDGLPPQPLRARFNTLLIGQVESIIPSGQTNEVTQVRIRRDHFA
jgi:hypothetical protein